ncbi:enoyl-CoA hydratase/isomerase family protein [Teichococcus aestuarii]|uniref:enoyl-CoA hydratase/isomerase family protein n=1 Tax=Teichococcus aestuarii TaxID=568898 RepID=UPI0036186832
MIRLMVGGSKPVVAAVEGWAAGAGLSLACACDTIVAAEDAQFMAAFGKAGLMADLGLPHTLPLRVGHARARQILLYGEPVGAEEALRIGWWTGWRRRAGRSPWRWSAPACWPRRRPPRWR